MIPFAFTFELKDILLILIGLFLGLFFSFFKKDYRQKREKKISDDLAYIKGINYVISNEPDRAIEELIKVVKFNPETVSAYIMLGNLFRSQGEYERAIRIHQSIVLREDLDQRIKLQAMFDLSLDFKKAGLFNRAIDSFKEVIKFSSDNIEAFIHLEDIYEEVTKVHPSLSLATIYKNIILMMEKGVLVEVPIVGKKSKYELSKVDHMHLICTECGEVEDRSCLDSTDKILYALTEQEHFKLNKRQINLYGVCEKCQIQEAS